MLGTASTFRPLTQACRSWEGIRCKLPRQGRQASLEEKTTLHELLLEASQRVRIPENAECELAGQPQAAEAYY